MQAGNSEGVFAALSHRQGNRSYFDVRSIYYLGFSTSDTQSQIPVIHPVIDYNYTFDHPVLGGELGYKFNFTSLTRNQANFDAITQTAIEQRHLLQTADPAVKTPANCLLRGVPGTYSRFSAEAHWRRTVTDRSARCLRPLPRCAPTSPRCTSTTSPASPTIINTGDTNLVRAMPTVGLEYRYPFINVQSWGTQTIEPIAQVIVRPNETQSASGRTKTPKA